MENSEKIRRIAEARGIQFLLHFTQASNLPGIVKHGLLPRRELEKPIYSAWTSAEHRLDENDDAVSVSISRLNERMFASKRDRSGHANWLILALSAEILWTHNCRFCWCNAARREIKEHRGWLGGPWAFEQMFAEDGARNGLPNCYPTDLEAEVQVLEVVAPKYLRAVLVNTPAMVAPVENALVELGVPSLIPVGVF